MRILGVDPGTITTGYGLVDYDDGRFKGIKWGIANAPSTWRRSQRLFTIFGALNGLVGEHMPDVIAVETPFVGRNPKTAIAMGQALAVVMLVAEAHRARLAYYSPAEVKIASTGSGRADKRDVATFVVGLLDLGEASPALTSDATDALAVAICHANRRDEAAILTRVDRP